MTDLIQLIGTTRPKFDVWPNRRSQLNPRTYPLIYTPTVVQGGGMEPLPGVFDMLQYFETTLPLVESPWSS